MPSREPELYKDKVEVSLDGRQIFYLFFGGAVIVGMVFVLGVLVGRRVEARGHIDQARTHAARDPLAALDRLEATSGALAFRGALTGKDAPTEVEATIARLEKARGKDAASAKSHRPETVAATKADTKAEAKSETKAETKAETKSETAKAEAKSETKSETKPETKTETKAASEGPVTRPDQAETKTATKPEAKPDAKPESKSDAKTEEPKQRYTIQLSSFQDRKEAEAFLAQVKAKGYDAKITVAEVAGKGTFYRVRMGSYRSVEAANSAKAELEKAGHPSASVMKL
jgi:DedD protein